MYRKLKWSFKFSFNDELLFFILAIDKKVNQILIQREEEKDATKNFKVELKQILETQSQQNIEINFKLFN